LWKKKYLKKIKKPKILMKFEINERERELIEHMNQWKKRLTYQNPRAMTTVTSHKSQYNSGSWFIQRKEVKREKKNSEENTDYIDHSSY
jgi:hypothetical protein